MDISSQWMHTHTYIPNILAGFTGFLIGVPVALVILATFTVEREEFSALKRVNRLSRLAWRDFRKAVYEFCSDDRLDLLDGQQLKDIKELTETFRNRLGMYPVRRRAQIPTDEDRSRLEADLRPKIDEWEILLTEVQAHVPKSDALALEWSDILSKWQILDQYVRLQRLERHLRWFADALNAGLRQHMSSNTDPMSEFSSATEPVAEEVSSALSQKCIDGALQSAKTYMQLGTDDLSNAIGATAFDYPHGDVGLYWPTITRAVESMRSLRELVEQVDAAGWPQSESNPIEDLEE
jgi:hypothetical protein